MYLDANGIPVSQVRRLNVLDSAGKIIDKTFRQYRVTSVPGQKVVVEAGLKETEKVLYRLPELIKADPDQPVFIVEGEKDVDRLRSLGLISTCNPEGAGKWKAAYSEALRDRPCVIIPDNDKAGADHARQLAQSLQGKAASIKVVELPGLPPKGDASDFLSAGGTALQLDELAQKAAEWEGRGNSPEINATSSGTALPSAKASSDEVPEPTEKARREPGPSQADILLRIASVATLFRDDANVTYAAVPMSGHIEVHAIYSTSFGQWLLREYQRQTKGKMPTAEALKTARDGLDALASAGPVEQVFLRVGEAGGNIYIDMGDPEWRAIEINARGWRIVDKHLIRFRRSDGVKPFPVPVLGGNLEDLRSFLNIPDEEFFLVVGWLASCLLPQGPYPILTLIGEQGCGKSTLADIAKRLVDPQKVRRSSPPKTPHDLAISASNRWVLSYENLTSLPSWLSDMLCTCSTGGGYCTRTLYLNREEQLFEFQRPVILNGIADFITSHPDLTDRGAFLHMPPIPKAKRQPEKEFWARFDAALPTLFGACSMPLPGDWRSSLNSLACRFRVWVTSLCSRRPSGGAWVVPTTSSWTPTPVTVRMPSPASWKTRPWESPL